MQQLAWPGNLLGCHTSGTEGNRVSPLQQTLIMSCCSLGQGHLQVCTSPGPDHKHSCLLSHWVCLNHHEQRACGCDAPELPARGLKEAPELRPVALAGITEQHEHHKVRAVPAAARMMTAAAAAANSNNLCRPVVAAAASAAAAATFQHADIRGAGEASACLLLSGQGRSPTPNPDAS